MARKNINIRAGFDLLFFSTESQKIQRELRKQGKKMQSIGRSMSMSLTAPIVALGGIATKTFADFEQSMAKVKAVSGAVGEEFNQLNDLAKQLGISTRFSATQVSDLMLNYSKLGFSAGEIQKITKATLNLALATGEDLATSAQVAGATLRGFGLDASQMTMVTDVMAKSFSSSALDLNKFQVAMSTVAPVARNAGVTLQETTSMLGVLANNGVEASTSGTALRNIFLELAKQGMSFDDAMAQINNSTNANSTALELFGKRGAAVASILAKNQSEVAGLNTELIDSAGAASEMADIMDDTLEGAMFKLKSATEGLGISFGKMLAPAVGKAAKFLANLAQKFANLSPQTKSLITKIAAITAIIGPLIFLIGSLTLAVGSLGMSLKTLMTSPVMLVTVGIAALVIHLTGLLDVFDSVDEKAKEVSKSTKMVADSMATLDDRVAKEKEGLESLFFQLKNTNHGTKQRKDLINEINSKYGTTLKNIKDEKLFINQLDSAYDDLVKNMTKKVRLSLTEESLKDLVDFENKLKSQLDNIKERMDIIPKSKFGQVLDDANTPLEFLGRNQKKFNQLSKEYSSIQKEIIKNQQEQKKLFPDETKTKTKTSDGGGGGVGATIDVIKEKYKSLGDIFDSLRTKSNDFFKSFVSDLNIVGTGHSIMTQEFGLLETITINQSSAFDKIGKNIKQYGQNLLESVGIMKMFSNAELGIQTKISELQELVQYLNQEIEKLVEDSAVMLGEFLGDAMTGEADAQDFGRGLLNAVGKFLQQMGAAMIAFGISFDSFTKAIALGPGGAALAIAGGIAMVAAGAAISNLSKKGIDNSSNTSPTSMSGGGMRGMVMQPISLETKISGRDLILVQNREKGFTR